MELTIEKLRKITDVYDKPRSQRTSPPSDLELADDELFDDVAAEYDAYHPTADITDRDNRLRAYTVSVDGRRVLTLSTYDNHVATRWIREVLCSHRRSGVGEIVLGVSVDREHNGYEKGGLKDDNYDIITLCMGSQCLVLELPDPYEYQDRLLPLICFFADARISMKAVTEKLFRNHEIRVTNVLDLSKGAEEVLKNSHELDLKWYNLDQLGTMVLGQSWFVERPKKLEWYHWDWYRRGGDMDLEKVKYATYDAYLSLMIGGKLVELKREKRNGGSGGKKSGKKGKK